MISLFLFNLIIKQLQMTGEIIPFEDVKEERKHKAQFHIRAPNVHMEQVKRSWLILIH